MTDPVDRTRAAVSSALGGSETGESGGLTEAEMQAVYTAYLKVEQPNRPELLAWINEQNPALAQALVLFDNAAMGWDHYVTHTAGQLENIVDNTTDRDALFAEVAERATHLAQQLGYSRVKYDKEGQWVLLDGGGIPNRLSISEKYTWHWALEWAHSHPDRKSSDLLFRELAGAMHRYRFGDLPVPPAELQFDAGATGHSGKNALWLAIAANLVYEIEDEIRATGRKWGFDPSRFHFESVNESEGLVAANDDFAVVSLRGTESVDDAVADSRIGQVHVSGRVHGRVHEGFNEALDLIYDQLKQKLDTFAAEGKPIYITGHSLGGGLAMLFTQRLINDGYDPSQLYLYTYGQPRTGNGELVTGFDALMKDRYFRYQNNADGVTRVPVPGVHDYVHGGQLIHFADNAEMWVNPGGLREWWDQAASFGRLHDHLMENYIELLLKHIHTDIELEQ